MKKFFYLSVFILTFLGSIFVFAASIADLQAEHGKELNKAPFHMRYKFQKTTGTQWKSSTYEQRKVFLENWYVQMDSEQNSAKQQAKLEQEKQLGIQRRKDKKKYLEQEKLRKEQELEKRQKKEREDLKKEFEDKIKKNDREIEEMHRQDRKVHR